MRRVLAVALVGATIVSCTDAEGANPTSLPNSSSRDDTLDRVEDLESQLQVALSERDRAVEEIETLVAEVESLEATSNGSDSSSGPPCDPLVPDALPWSDIVGRKGTVVVGEETTSVEYVGPVYYTSIDGSETREGLVTIIGRGPEFEKVVSTAPNFGVVFGFDAYLRGLDATDTSSVEVAWSESDAWCDAYLVALDPDPFNTAPNGRPQTASDISEYVEHLFSR